VPRSGFETAFDHDGYAKYVFVHAKDKDGKTLGTSPVKETVFSKDISSVAIAEELLWLQRGSGLQGWAAYALSSPITTFVAGIICGAIVVISTLFVVKSRHRWVNFRRNLQYERIASRDAAEFDEMTLDDLSPSKPYNDEIDCNGFKVSEESADKEEGP
jgi:hypothetical protein